jgi:hypothetical protein
VSDDSPSVKMNTNENTFKYFGKIKVDAAEKQNMLLATSLVVEVPVKGTVISDSSI